GEFGLQPPVVMPRALNTRAAIHPVAAQESPRFTPLPADPVQPSVDVALLGREPPIAVPTTRQPVTLPVAERDSLANFTGPKIKLLDGGLHGLSAAKEGARTQRTPTSGTAKRLGGKHAKPRPMGRALRRLSRSLKIRGFLVRPSRCDAKSYVFCYIISI